MQACTILACTDHKEPLVPAQREGDPWISLKKRLFLISQCQLIYLEKPHMVFSAGINVARYRCVLFSRNLTNSGEMSVI